MNKKRWVLKRQDKGTIEYLSKALSLNPLAVNVMMNRGLKSKDEMNAFIHPDTVRFHDPFLLKGMEKAVLRIRDAIDRKEKIAVYGDYDVDGITSVSILYLALRELGADIIYYIPDRAGEGYGLHSDALKLLCKQGVTLVITVDCGISACQEVLFGKSCGLDIIVTDHHRCPEVLPDAYAVINPKQTGCSYPFDELAGVGVAFKLIQALYGMDKLPYLIDKYGALVALGTVADIVPLKDENRGLVYYGLKSAGQNTSVGFHALIEVAGFAGKPLNSGILGFQLAPRLNAAGRMGSAGVGVELFITSDRKKAFSIARLLDEQNLCRREAEQKIFEEACQMIVTDRRALSQNILVLKGRGWHRGVIGIVASRLTEKYYKPCILFTEENGELQGSARSVKGFNIYDAIHAVSSYTIRFGGHELAAGLSIKSENYDRFKLEIEAYCRDTIGDETPIQEIFLDGEIHESDMTNQLVEDLELLEPFGMGNAEPNFLFRNARIVRKSAFKEGRHLKLSLCQRHKYIEAVGFSMGGYSTVLKNGDQVSIAGNLYINEYRGEKYFSIRINDIRLS